ncbi:hypothetical protein JD844_021684 [Phrynosoma platyrhinos]|uniref:Doublecortin domain-containing protein n=1 Tax=Phrynosoma platyrhinos TaxID=52577 RepID=A0ABQ7STZ8_PHRPL|nr:hypothetical protein JD844_021684 [Phrynosoma platyrhinos]
MSPYTKTAKKAKEKQSELLLGCKTPLQSSVISRRSELQDGTTDQIKSVQKSDRVSDLVSYKSNSTNNFCLISPSKRNRPVSVPPVDLLLEECTEKLKLNMAARRVFLADGSEALDAIDIPHDADVYISTGEPFSNPFKKIKVVSGTQTRAGGRCALSFETRNSRHRFS